MLQPDFSEIQKNGFRISRFRLFHSSQKLYKGNDLLKERDDLIAYLIEQDEIYFTISYFAIRMMFMFILATIISLLPEKPELILTLVFGLLSISLYTIARYYRVSFILGDLGIQVALTIYNSKIYEMYGID